MTRPARFVMLPAALAAVAAASSALAQQPQASRPEPVPEFRDQLVLDSGRTPFSPPHAAAGWAEVHGEYQLRYTRQTDLALPAPASAPDATSLGRKNLVYHWFRISPRFQLSRSVTIVGQLDYPRGFMIGDETSYVSAAAEPMREKEPFGVDARWLYLDARTRYGHFRIGQQGSHWGMGILANDGNHPVLFGDYRRGDIVERVMYAVRPAGRRSLLTTALAADLVYRDDFGSLTDRDRAVQGVAMLVYGTERNQVGFYGVTRHQARSLATQPSSPYTDSLSVRIADVSGRFTLPVPGTTGFVFGSAEAVVVAGTTRYAQNPSVEPSQKQRVQSWGAAFQLGTVHEAHDGKARWGDLVVAIEWGLASGDSNPFDSTQKRFTFDPNHRVGLLLFDQAMHWMTARSAVNADLSVRDHYAPGLQYMPTNGGVSGATYLNPTVVVRPRPWLDFKGGLVLAQATSDMVDPYLTLRSGRWSNLQGGPASNRDLGVELDLGSEARLAMPYGVTMQLGVQGGVLFPGSAFDGPSGVKLANQYMGMGRFGLQY